MKTASMIAATAAALLLTFTLGCGPAAPTNIDTSTSSSNTTAAGGNVTAGTDTPAGETP